MLNSTHVCTVTCAVRAGAPAVNMSATTLIYQDNSEKTYIIISMWENICAAAAWCRVMPASQKRRWERSRELQL